jgi:CHASE2 domain-containing sensor protein
MGLIILLIFAFLIFIAFIFLQIFLSNKDNKLLGLILPVITFLFSLVIVSSIAFDNYYGLPIVPIAFALFIPTIILFALYAACRGKKNKRRALEKMSIQDLD